MADNNINLLPDQTVEPTPAAKQNKMLTQLSVIVLVVTIVVTAAILAVKFLYINTQLSSLETQTTEQRQQIASRQAVEGVYRSLANQLSAAESFIGSQKHYSRFLTEFGKTVPSGVILTQMSVDASQQVTIMGTSTGYADLSGLQAKLAAVGGQNIKFYFTNPAVTSISRTDQSSPIQFTASFSIAPTLVVGPSGE